MIGLPELMIILLFALLFAGLGNRAETALLLTRTLISLWNRPSGEQKLLPKVEAKDHANHEQN